MVELIGNQFGISVSYIYINMTRFTLKNIFAQQFCCYFWILQWIIMQVIPSLSVFLLACLLLSLCVSLRFWEHLAFSHVLPLILSRKPFRFWNGKTSCMHIDRSCSFLWELEYIESDLHLSTHLNSASWSSSVAQTSQQAEQRLRSSSWPALALQPYPHHLWCVTAADPTALCLLDIYLRNMHAKVCLLSYGCSSYCAVSDQMMTCEMSDVLLCGSECTYLIHEEQ